MPGTRLRSSAQLDRLAGKVFALVHSEHELSLRGLLRSVSTRKGACAVSAATSDFVVAEEGSPAAVAWGHVDHAVVHKLRGCCEERRLLAASLRARVSLVSYPLP